MKKLFAILAIASVMTACNSAEEKAATTDTLKTETPITDAVKTADSAANQMMTNAADSASKMMNKVADSAGKVVEKVKEAVKH